MKREARAGVCLAKQLAVAAEDVRHLQSGRHDPASGGRNDFDIQAIERLCVLPIVALETSV